MTSSEQQLILVDPADRPLGSLERGACHEGDGVLHRAFSILVFDTRGRLLLQQRSPQKSLWHGFWSNSCCGHPLAGEEAGAAAQRRLGEELGFHTPLQPAFKFQYAASFEDLGAERELCSVFLGRYDGPVSPAEAEISDWRWAAPRELAESLREAPSGYTPWFRVIWRVLGLPRSTWTGTAVPGSRGSIPQ